MTPDEHANYAEALLESDRREGGKIPLRQVVLLRAVVHAILSLRGTRAPRGGGSASGDVPEIPRPARKKPGPKPRPKKSTTSTKEKDA